MLALRQANSQEVGEHLSRHRHLGRLESDVATVADDLGADLDKNKARYRGFVVLK
jgi:hypothetical protein